VQLGLGGGGQQEERETGKKFHGGWKGRRNGLAQAFLSVLFPLP